MSKLIIVTMVLIFSSPYSKSDECEGNSTCERAKALNAKNIKRRPVEIDPKNNNENCDNAHNKEACLVKPVLNGHRLCEFDMNEIDLKPSDKAFIPYLERKICCTHSTIAEIDKINQTEREVGKVVGVINISNIKGNLRNQEAEKDTLKAQRTVYKKITGHEYTIDKNLCETKDVSLGTPDDPEGIALDVCKQQALMDNTVMPSLKREREITKKSGQTTPSFQMYDLGKMYVEVNHTIKNGLKKYKSTSGKELDINKCQAILKEKEEKDKDREKAQN